MDRALPSVNPETLSKAYVGFLGFYNSAGSLKWSKSHLVEVANRFSTIIGELIASCEHRSHQYLLSCGLHIDVNSINL